VTLEQRMYRDPLVVLLEVESRSCRGCMHQKDFVAFGKPVTICMAKDEKNKRRNHGKRCKAYKEKTV
jgi:hypothetical protein